MAATMFIEEESGTYIGRVHPHNGYYAGNFSSPHVTEVAERPVTGRTV